MNIMDPPPPEPVMVKLPANNGIITSTPINIINESNKKYENKIKPLKQILSKTISVHHHHRVEIININNRNIYTNENIKEIDINEKKSWRNYMGILLAIQSSFVFSITALIVKYFDNHNPISISLWRFQGALWPVIPFFIYNQFYKNKNNIIKKSKSEISTSTTTLNKLKLLTLLIARSILTCNAFILNFYSLKYLELGDALAIASSTPVFVTLFAHYFLGEQCGMVPILTAILTIFGVIVIARPPHLTGEEGFDFDTLIGTTLALSCMLLSTVSYVILRYLRRIHYSSVILAFGAWGTMENLFLAILFGVLSFPEGKQEWILASLLIVLSLCGQLSIIFALKKEHAGPVALVRTCDVIFAFCWQISCLGRLPDLFSLIGAIIIVFGIVLTALRKWISTLPANNMTRRRLWYLLT